MQQTGNRIITAANRVDGNLKRSLLTELFFRTHIIMDKKQAFY